MSIVISYKSIIKNCLNKYFNIIGTFCFFSNNLLFGRMVKNSATFYLTGGATAILYDFREGTIDIDIAGDMDELFSYIPKIKERLQINIEIAKPTDFTPSLQGEEDRHITIGTFGKVTFMHFDPYAQAFSKIVRGHETDIADVKERVGNRMCLMGNVNPLEIGVRGTPEEVREATLDVLEKSGGEGIILSVGGGTSPGMPRQNILAMLGALEEFNSVHAKP